MTFDVFPIRTRALVLRRFTTADAASLWALSNETTARTWLPSQVYRDQAHAAAVLEGLIGQYAQPGHPARGAYVLAIEHAADRAVIGHVGFSPLQDDVEIGFAVGRRWQRQGFAAEAVTAASQWALREFGLERIVAITAAANHASGRTLMRAGFVLERDQVMRFQGTEQPVSVYMLTAGTGRNAAAGPFTTHDLR